MAHGVFLIEEKEKKEISINLGALFHTLMIYNLSGRNLPSSISPHFN